MTRSSAVLQYHHTKGPLAVSWNIQATLRRRMHFNESFQKLSLNEKPEPLGRTTPDAANVPNNRSVLVLAIGVLVRCDSCVTQAPPPATAAIKRSC